MNEGEGENTSANSLSAAPQHCRDKRRGGGRGGREERGRASAVTHKRASITHSRRGRRDTHRVSRREEGQGGRGGSRPHAQLQRQGERVHKGGGHVRIDNPSSHTTRTHARTGRRRHTSRQARTQHSSVRVQCVPLHQVCGGQCAEGDGCGGCGKELQTTRSPHFRARVDGERCQRVRASA